VRLLPFPSTTINNPSAGSYIQGKPPGKGTAAIELADFFKYSPNEGYDLVYDYT
jgi:hypothetical protein